MANTIKKQQKQQLRKYINKAAKTVRVTQLPRVKDLGTLRPAKLTRTKIVVDPGQTRGQQLKKQRLKRKMKKK